MSSGQIQRHLESPSSSETLQFNPATGKLEVVPKRVTQQQRSQTSGVDQRVALDMNKPGSGGFFYPLLGGVDGVD